MTGKVVPLAKAADLAVRQIRKLAAAGEVTFTNHAEARMKERGISPTQVYDVLARGIVHEPAALDVHGNWKVTMRRRTAGEEVFVAAALVENVVVITVF